MEPVGQLALLFLGAYLLGSTPFGLIVSRLNGIDIRRHGSGNIGATNVWRVLGARWGLPVFLLDAGKGTVATVVAGWFVADFPWSTPARDLAWWGAGCCCIIGSIAPVFLRFRGGKGVAASLGAGLGVYPYLTWPGVISFIMWALVTRLSGFVSIGSIAAALTLPMAFFFCACAAGCSLGEHYPLLALTVLMAVLVVGRHRENLRRIAGGTENRRDAGT